MSHLKCFCQVHNYCALGVLCCMCMYARVPSDFNRVCAHTCQYLCIQRALCVPCVFKMRGKLSVFACVGVSWEHSRSSHFAVSLKNTNFRPFFFSLSRPSILFKPSAVPFLPPPLALFHSILSSLHHAWPNEINLSVSLGIDTHSYTCK